MRNENVSPNVDKNNDSEVRIFTAKEAVMRERIDIEVPENSEIVLSPSNPEFKPHFARVVLRTYDDLRILGFIPRGLADDKVRQAIAEDDAEVYDLACKMIRHSPNTCSCSGETIHAPASHGNPIRGIYNGFRKRHNPSLARLLSDHYGSPIAWDGTIPVTVRKWATSIYLKPEILLILSGDIKINKNSTLSLSSNSKLLLAWNIWIHSTGKLISNGSYIKIWANSINHFNYVVDVQALNSARNITPVWSLSE